MEACSKIDHAGLQLQKYKLTSSVTAMLEELDWQWLRSRRKKARLSMLYNFRHGLLKIDSK